MSHKFGNMDIKFHHIQHTVEQVGLQILDKVPSSLEKPAIKFRKCLVGSPSKTGCSSRNSSELVLHDLRSQEKGDAMHIFKINIVLFKKLACTWFMALERMANWGGVKYRESTLIVSSLEFSGSR